MNGWTILTFILYLVGAYGLVAAFYYHQVIKALKAIHAAQNLYADPPIPVGPHSPAQAKYSYECARRAQAAFNAISFPVFPLPPTSNIKESQDKCAMLLKACQDQARGICQSCLSLLSDS